MENKQLQDFARKTLKDNLKRLTEQQQNGFKWIYGGCTYDEAKQKNINDVVDKLDPEKIDGALQKVQHHLDRHHE